MRNAAGAVRRRQPNPSRRAQRRLNVALRPGAGGHPAGQHGGRSRGQD